MRGKWNCGCRGSNKNRIKMGRSRKKKRRKERRREEERVIFHL